MEKNKSKKIII